METLFSYLFLRGIAFGFWMEWMVYLPELALTNS